VGVIYLPPAPRRRARLALGHRTPETPQVVRLMALGNVGGRVAPWPVRVPLDLLCKSRLERIVDIDPDVLAKAEVGRTYTDERGSFRWITVHPHGDEERGIPVKIRESKTEPGTWHVVGGAGGKLNYLRLTNVKSPAEYRKQADEKRRARKEAEKDKAAARKVRLESMTDEERQATFEAERAEADARKDAADKAALTKREFIAKVAAAAGWKDEEWKFDATAQRLKAAGADPDRIEQQERAHFKRVFNRAKQIEREAKRTLLLDHEARLAVGLGEVPLKADDSSVIALSDLDPDKAGKGLGYRRDVTKMSDAEITRQLAAEDVGRLRTELTDALEQVSHEAPATVGRVEQLKADLRVAEIIQQNADVTPEELAERERAVSAELADARREYEEAAKEVAAWPDHGKGDEWYDAHFDEAFDRLELAKSQVAGLMEKQDEVEILKGRQEKAVVAARKEVRSRATQEKEQWLRDAEGDDAVQRRRTFIAKLQSGLQGYRAEIETLKAAGVLTKPELPSPNQLSPQAAADIVRSMKEVRKIEQAEQKGGEALDKLFGRGYFVETRQAKLDADIRRDVEAEIAEARTKTFLRELEASDRDPSLLDLTENERRDSLQRHISAGSFNALNNASLTLIGQAVLSRDACDVLGAAAAGQVLARAIHQTRGPEEVRALAEAVSDYHLKHHLEASEEAVRTAQALYDQVKEIELGAAENPGDLAVMQELNAKRREKLLEARQILGQTLGDMEATAALQLALKAGPTKEVHANLGPISPDSAVRQVRALGLGRNDFEVTTDGVNQFLTIHQSGLDKIAEPVDAGELRLAEEIEAIKRGDRDEDGWLPPGIVRTPATKFTKERHGELPSIGAELAAQRPPVQWGSGERGIAGDIEDFIGASLADGRDPNDILPDLMRQLASVPGEHQGAAVAYLNEHMPATVIAMDGRGRKLFVTDENGEPVTGEDGKPIPRYRQARADEYEAHMQKLADQYMERRYPSGEVAAFHAQSIPSGIETTRAVYAAIAEDPRAVAAFKDPAELTTQDKAALRHYFNTEVAKVSGNARVDEKALERSLAELGPEPAKVIKGQGGLFGGGEDTANPDWLEWKRRHDEIVTTAQDAGSAWSDYVTTHRNDVRRAYLALQDRMKGQFLERFHRYFPGSEGLRAGKRTIRYADRHLAYLDPEKRAAIREQEAKLRASSSNRDVAGRYASGSIRDKMDWQLGNNEIMRQNTVDLFGAAPAKKGLDVHERFALGQRAEAQLGALVDTVGKSFRYATDQPINLDVNVNMSGPNVARQRTIKAFLAGKRIGAFLGAGSGKTSVALGGFTAAASDPATGVKRGIFVVPSQVQGQFHGEMARFVDPASGLNWHANPGAPAEERFAAHRDPDTHMVVMTHQGFRDDMLRLVADHLGVDRDAAGAQFQRLGRKERAKLLREAWGKAGVDYQAAFLDEGHVTLDRKGKRDSLLSAMMTAVSDNAPYYMAMTADPAKNDVSEIRSQMAKFYPDGRYDDEQDWHKRYGLNTSASREALRRQIAPKFFTHHITPDVGVTRDERALDLHPEQQADYDRTLRTYDRARVARLRGSIDVDAVKELSPGSFEGRPADEHEGIARRLTDSLGIIRDAALHRIVNASPAEKNAKVQHVLEFLGKHPVKDKPVVIFAHNHASVDMLEKAVRAAGHRVTTLTGKHSSEVKDQRRRAFQPDKGKEAEADVLIMSDAGATGLNLQRGQTLINYDTPMTAMGHAQRNARIWRCGQKQDVDLVDLVTKTPFEASARRRLERKYDLRDTVTGQVDTSDDSQLSSHVGRALEQKRQADIARNAPLAA